MRKRTIRIGKRLNDQVMQETWRATSQTDDRCQLEMRLPGDRRKGFVTSTETAHVRSADQHSARNFELVVARCSRGGRGKRGGRYFAPAAPISKQSQSCSSLSPGSRISRLWGCDGDLGPGRNPKPAALRHALTNDPHDRLVHIAMKIQPMQQIADHIARSRSRTFEALPTIDRDIRAVRWRLWHGRVGRSIRDLEQLLGSKLN
ncbi:hypothetical protein [Bradyrhizobium sp. LB14.3]|uniref:hypothetical protein n=1 Tax=Bradyrhizobium sp. LB14.3 TaxID=3156328 RepID=UPI0033977D29